MVVNIHGIGSYHFRHFIEEVESECDWKVNQNLQHCVHKTGGHTAVEQGVGSVDGAEW